MPHTDSAKKRLRQYKKRRALNRAVKGDLRTSIKKLFKALKENKGDDAKKLLQECSSKLDKCGARRYLHPNTAHRYKSRLSKRVAGLSASTSA